MTTACPVTAPSGAKETRVMNGVFRNLFASLLAAGLVATALSARAETVLRTEETAPGELDPSRVAKYSDGMLAFNVYDALVLPGAGANQIEPLLADSWIVEGNTYTFKLRTDAKFHSGNPVTAEDVVFSLERMSTMGTGFSFLFRGRVATAEAVDPSTVRFTLKTPFAPFVANLARLPILDSKTVMANKKDGQYGTFGDYGQEWLMAHDAGSGAYHIESHNPQELSVLVKNKSYFLGVPDAAPDMVRLRYGLDTATIRALISRGELDIASQWMAPEVKRALANQPGMRLVSEYGLGQFYIQMNTKKPPLDDVHCRRALAYAFDYKAALSLLTINKEIVAGKPSRGPLPDGALGADPNAPVFAQDMDKARAEQALCKYKPAESKLEISWIAVVAIEERFGLIMQQSFAALGYPSDVVRLPYPLYTDRASKPETTPHFSQIYVNAITPDPDAVIYNMYHSNVAGTWQATSWLLDPEVDALLDQGRTITETSARAAIYNEVRKKIIDLQPTIYGFQNVALFVARDTVDIPALQDPDRMRHVNAANFMFRQMRMKP
jgi:peptide/nickel transport system substrate-binding protein